MAGWWICCWHTTLPRSPEAGGRQTTDILKKSMRDIAILWKRRIAWISFFAYNYSKLLSGRKNAARTREFLQKSLFHYFLPPGSWSPPASRHFLCGKNPGWRSRRICIRPNALCGKKRGQILRERRGSGSAAPAFVQSIQKHPMIFWKVREG